MHLVVLNVASPFSLVGPEAAGGAEQLLTRLDTALVRQGQESIVVACDGSQVEGILLSTPPPAGSVAHVLRQKTREQYRYLLDKFLERWPIDLIHLHDVDFHEYLPQPGVPVLVTLHEPLDKYPPEIFQLKRPQTYLNCVSATQRQSFPRCANVLPEIETGSDGVVEKYLAVYEQLVREAREREIKFAQTSLAA
jgi:hypothetical protein